MVTKIKGKIKKSKSQEKREAVMGTSPVPTGTSPVPAKKVEMLSFPDAIREVLNKKRLTRVAWDNIDTYIVLHDEFLYIHLDKTLHPLITSLGDMEGIDWYVLPDKETN